MAIRMSGDDDDRKTQKRRQTGALVKERPRTKKPPMYKVLLHNDDYTTREFVVLVLQDIFHLSESDATRIMMHVHNNGIGVAGVYTFEVAETKIEKTMALARKFEFPLQLTMEPED
jgi:ATP-dependent Clp protease adaptor protein ClpS